MSKSRRFEGCGNRTLDCGVASRFRGATSAFCHNTDFAKKKAGLKPYCGAIQILSAAPAMI
jgi:hypothetical protein